MLSLHTLMRPALRRAAVLCTSALLAALPAWAAEEDAPSILPPLTLQAVDLYGSFNLGARLEAQSELTSLIGQPVSAELLDRVLQQVNSHYRALGYRHAKAYLPEQIIKSDGRLKVYLANARLDEVSFMMPERDFLRSGTAAMFREGFESFEGQPVNEQELEGQILKLADLGIFDLQGSFAPSQTPPSQWVPAWQNLDLTAGEKDPLSFSVFADNHGTEASGRYRFGGLLSWRNPTKSADLLSLFYARSSHRQHNYALTYQIPVSSHPTVIGTSICLTDYELGREYADLGAEGRSWEFSLFVKEPLYRTSSQRTYFTAGYRYRDLTDEFTEFDLKFKQHSHALWAAVDEAYAAEDFSLGGRAMLTLGKLTNDDDFELYDESIYKILNLNALASFKVHPLLSLNADLEVQLTPDDVDSSEEFVAGGALGVSGYDSNVLSGDSGALLKLYPEFRPFKDSSLAIRPNFKAAVVKDQEWERDTLASVGLELETSCHGLYAQLSFDAAVGDKPYSDLDDGKVWFEVGYRC